MSDEQQDTSGPGEPARGKDKGSRTMQEAAAAEPMGSPLNREAPTPGGDGGAAVVQVLRMLFNRSIEFSKSGFFFILLGCGFLYFAYSVLYHVHPTFVFILALLGLSIVLFGTGTQSLGSGEFSEPGSQARVKFYLAGGAGKSANAVAHEGGVFETIERKNTDIFLRGLRCLSAQPVTCAPFSSIRSKA